MMKKIEKVKIKRDNTCKLTEISLDDLDGDIKPTKSISLYESFKVKSLKAQNSFTSSFNASVTNNNVTSDKSMSAIEESKPMSYWFNPLNLRIR